MTARVASATAVGFEGHIIEVECDKNKGLPSLTIVGLGDKAISEAKERVRSAVHNSHLEFPANKLTINLAPADLPKDGTHFDVPIALSILIASGQLQQKSLDGVLVAGELSLDGDLRPVRGIVNIVETARAHGYHTVIVPRGNAAQATLIKDVSVIGAGTLVDIYLHLIGEKKITVSELTTSIRTKKHTNDLADVRGQEQAKRALIIAAAGGHNLLMDGPPGAGKTMLARTLASLLPPLTYEEQIEITKLQSLVGENTDDIVTTRPFRTPHHTASPVSLIGGGAKPLPGEVSLAHCGVLFLDELPEYPRMALESLRQPLEDRTVTVSRANGRVTYPASFMLVATKNPCPCGYYGDPTHECRCSMQSILNYEKRVSGPLLDRIDLVVTMSRVPEKDLLSSTENRTESPAWQQKIAKLRALQRERNNGKSNAEIPSKNIAQQTRLSNEATTMLNTASDRLKLSARSYFKTIKVARTIADLEQSDKILPSHIAEALQYRLRTRDQS